MKITIYKDYEDMSRASASCILETIQSKKDANICISSGESPRLAYKMLVDDIKTQNIDYSDIQFTKLDEWCGVTSDSLISCERFVRENIIEPLNVNEDHYLTFVCENDEMEEVEKVRQALAEKPLDLCILGLGKNGHLGLNEPDTYAEPFAHISELSEKTNTHSMLQGEKRTNGMTIGIQEILASKKILLIVSGDEKQEVFEKFLTQRVDPQVPASFLWLHSNVEVHVQGDKFSL